MSDRPNPKAAEPLKDLQRDVHHELREIQAELNEMKETQKTMRGVISLHQDVLMQHLKAIKALLDLVEKK